MKYVILLALVAMASAAHYDHGDPLHVMVHGEVRQIVSANPGISLDDCIAKCDAIFDLAVHHNEHLTDVSCRHECGRALHQHHHHHSTTASPMETTSE